MILRGKGSAAGGKALACVVPGVLCLIVSGILGRSRQGI